MCEYEGPFSYCTVHLFCVTTSQGFDCGDGENFFVWCCDSVKVRVFRLHESFFFFLLHLSNRTVSNKKIQARVQVRMSILIYDSMLCSMCLLQNLSMNFVSILLYIRTIPTRTIGSKSDWLFAFFDEMGRIGKLKHFLKYL